VVSAGVYSRVRTERRGRQTGACNRYREFGGEWRVSDTAKAKSAKSTSILCALQLSCEQGTTAILFSTMN
jgi:hypothetical protein